MAGEFALAGLSSGFDWRSVVDQLIQIERIPQNRLRAEKEDNSDKLGLLDTLKERLEALRTASKDLSGSDTFTGRKVTGFSEDSPLSAAASAGTPLGSYSISVGQLASRTHVRGGSDVGGAINPDAVLSVQNIFPPVADGTITINGQEVEIDTTRTLNEIISDLNTNLTGVSVELDAVTQSIRFSDDSGNPLEFGHESDTSNFLTAFGIFSSNEVGNDVVHGASLDDLGRVNLNSAVTASGLSGTISDGSFKINGVEITYTADESLSTILSRVNSSAAGVNFTYDPGADKFDIENEATGSLGLTLEDTSGGLLAAMELSGGAETKTFGDNAQVTINGASFTSTTNTFDASLHGITGLSISADQSATTPVSETISVGTDSQVAKEKIEAFISAFNRVQDFIENQTKTTTVDGEVTTKPFSGNLEVSRLSSQLRGLAFASIAQSDTDVRRLESMGIDFISGTSKLEIGDSAKLEEMLAQEEGDVVQFFTNETDGLAKRMEDFVDNFVASGGTIETQKTSLNRKNNDLDTQIERLDRFIASEKERLEKSFIRMEEMQAQLNAQSQSLLQAFAQ